MRKNYVDEKILFDFLKMLNIEYQLFMHQPVFTSKEKPTHTTDEGLVEEIAIPGTQFKNLFLKDEKSNSFYLVAVPEHKRVDLKELSSVLGCSRFSFGKAEELLELLKLPPGSVTPFGLMFDKENKVVFVLDEDFLLHPPINFHPLRNDMTIGMSPQDFLICMEKMTHRPHIVRIPTK